MFFLFHLLHFIYDLFMSYVVARHYTTTRKKGTSVMKRYYDPKTKRAIERTIRFTRRAVRARKAEFLLSR